MILVQENRPNQIASILAADGLQAKVRSLSHCFDVRLMGVGGAGDLQVSGGQ